MRRHRKTILIATILLATVAVVVFFARLPRTSQQRFTHVTGVAYPSDAIVIADADQHRQGMVENLKSEGTSVFHFRTSIANARHWIAGPPPWGTAWARDVVPIWVNNARPTQALFYSQTGDQGSGNLLAVDSESGDVWLFNWSW